MRGLTVNDMDFQQRDPDRPGEAGIRIRTFIEGRDGTFLGRTVESSAGPDELGAGSNFQNGRVFSARRTGHTSLGDPASRSSAQAARRASFGAMNHHGLMPHRVQIAARDLPPGSFAPVMASGIIAIALDLTGHHTVSLIPAGVTGAGYLLLILMTGYRVIVFPAAFATDFRSRSRSVGHFTFVAGTNVVGVLALLRGWPAAAIPLFTVGLLAWLVLGYVVPWSVLLGRRDGAVLPAVDGTWLLWAVSSHSVAIAAADLEVAYVGVRQYLAALAILAWALGVVQYGVVVVVLLLRFAARPVHPADLDPSYWVSMGALAITAVAGAQITEMDSAPMVNATRAVIAGLSVIAWCVATWLIPVLVAVGWWRHIRHRIPLRYETSLWSLVFPLGMYAVAGIDLGRADHLPLVQTIGAAWAWVATAVWATVLVASTRIVPGGDVTPNRRCRR